MAPTSNGVTASSAVASLFRKSDVSADDAWIEKHAKQRGAELGPIAESNMKLWLAYSASDPAPCPFRPIGSLDELEARVSSPAVAELTPRGMKIMEQGGHVTHFLCATHGTLRDAQANWGPIPADGDWRGRMRAIDKLAALLETEAGRERLKGQYKAAIDGNNGDWEVVGWIHADALDGGNGRNLLAVVYSPTVDEALRETHATGLTG